jgi:hypothetical protein
MRGEVMGWEERGREAKRMNEVRWEERRYEEISLNVE